MKVRVIRKRLPKAVFPKLMIDPSQAIRASIGINEPNTDGAKPSFYSNWTIALL